MKATCEVIRNDYGVMLISGSSKYILSESKYRGKGNYAPYFLKQVAPVKEYITGLFKKKNENKERYRRKSRTGGKVVISIFDSVGTLEIH